MQPPHQHQVLLGVNSIFHLALVGKNGDPQTGWMKEGVLERRGCSFQVDKFQQLSTIQCIVSDVACLN